MKYACEIWHQNQNNIIFQRISNLQENAFRIFSKKRDDAPADPLFKEKRALKISDFIKKENGEFAGK